MRLSRSLLFSVALISGCMMEVGEPGVENVDSVYEDEVAVSGSALSLITTLSEVSADRFHGVGGPRVGRIRSRLGC